VGCDARLALAVAATLPPEPELGPTQLLALEEASRR
jgi:hypothetical protein